MAELRRVGGAMEPMRRPAGRRTLLPIEADLCNTVGLTEDEYWQFVEKTEAYNGQRPEGYELIPDVRNDPVSLIVNLVIGIALSAAAALLAPKPKSPQKQEGPQSIRTEDIQGRSRFAPQTQFDSLQELAALGAVVPLVFTSKGVRVSASLVWSQMLSLGTGQQLRAIMLFSSGDIEGRPDFAGYAIGSQLLENYTNAKIALYFRNNGGRITEGGGNRYGEGTAASVGHSDAFSIYWNPTGNYRPFFSGARTPSSQTQFGVYAPMPNGMQYKVPYEAVLIYNNGKESKDASRKKRSKINSSYPYRAAVIGNGGGYVTYRLDGSTDNGKGWEPWGTEDVKSAVESARVTADESIGIGNQYLAGTALVIAHSVPINPWEIGYTKDSSFRILEGGAIDTAGVLDKYDPYQRLTLQRVAIGTVSNNRSCHATEIGIKSTVFKQIQGFANVNSHPGQSTLEDFEEDSVSFSLGSLTKYVTRMSFFQLQVRPLGSNASWTDISGGKLFCVRGQTPQPHYNYIRVHHSFGQFEFRLRPYPGNAVVRYFDNREVWLLRTGSRISYSEHGYNVVFDGERLFLNRGNMTNTEWTLGTPPTTTGAVVGATPGSAGAIPQRDEWGLVQTRYEIDNDPEKGGYDGEYFAAYSRRDGDNYKTYLFVWDEWLGRTKDNAYTDGDIQYRAKDPNAYRGPIEKYVRRTGDLPAQTTQTVSASGGSGSGAQFRVELWSNGASRWTLVSGGSGYRAGETLYIPGANQSVRITSDYEKLQSLNFYDAVSDYVKYDAERPSHMDAPEHEIVYVNEQIEQGAPNYNSLAIAGLRLDSSTEWSSFSSLSAYFTRGVRVERLVTSGSSATNLMPEIAYALLTNATLGAGSLIGKDQVNRDRMELAARFCAANGFTWDGVIDERQNLREWIFEQAGYCLLDFTILGGQFSLVPSVPYNSNYTINNNAAPAIKALFTDGNIRNMKVTFLAPEERQLFRAVCLWRQDKHNGFPETRTLTVRLSDSQGGSAADPEETFDMSGFCTTEAHALTFAKYALKLRKEIDHAVTFETTPQAAMNLAPGDYFRLASEVTHTSRFNNGSIGPDGSITSADQLNGNYSILYWEPGTTGVKSGTLQASGNKTTQAALFGTVFTLQNSTTINRVYKVESLSYADDGLVEVAASYAPLTSSGSLAVLQWSNSHFVIETG